MNALRFEPARSSIARRARPVLPPLEQGPAAGIAALSYVVPLVLSIGANPAPANPTTMAWYAALRKPRWRPADRVVPLVWLAIETGMASGAYLLLRHDHSAARSRALMAWAFNVAMIGGWSRIFFKRRNLPASTVAAAAMVATGAVYVREARTIEPAAANAGVPFVGWVAFATLLTASIWALNRR